ncbi:MAG: S1/P1 nuclease [Gemmatimonadota bacterium]
MRNLIPVAVAVAFMLPAPSSASPGMWGGDGHRILCGIAWQRLTPEARALATRLLGSNDEKVFVAACVWADEVRADRPETYNYHFINIPAGVSGMDMTRDCAPPKRCAPWAIVHYGRILADVKADRNARTEALKWVLHFVGDLHQPLHAGRPEDLGGNRVFVDFFGDSGRPDRRNNLHSVWDSQMLHRAGHQWPAASRQLSAELSADETRGWETLNVTAWTNESYRLCEAFVYGKLRTDGRIRNGYFEPGLGYAEVQLMKGGVRLAHLINRAAAGFDAADFSELVGSDA